MIKKGFIQHWSNFSVKRFTLQELERRAGPITWQKWDENNTLKGLDDHTAEKVRYVLTHALLPSNEEFILDVNGTEIKVKNVVINHQYTIKAEVIKQATRPKKPATEPKTAAKQGKPTAKAPSRGKKKTLKRTASVKTQDNKTIDKKDRSTSAKAETADKNIGRGALTTKSASGGRIKKGRAGAAATSVKSPTALPVYTLEALKSRQMPYVLQEWAEDSDLGGLDPSTQQEVKKVLTHAAVAAKEFILKVGKKHFQVEIFVKDQHYHIRVKALTLAVKIGSKILKGDVITTPKGVVLKTKGKEYLIDPDVYAALGRQPMWDDPNLALVYVGEGKYMITEKCEFRPKDDVQEVVGKISGKVKTRIKKAQPIYKWSRSYAGFRSIREPTIITLHTTRFEKLEKRGAVYEGDLLKTYEAGIVKTFNNIEKTTKRPYFAHFLIERTEQGGSVNVRQYAPMNRMVFHAGDNNQNNIGIEINAGKAYEPTQRQLLTAFWLTSAMVDKYKSIRVITLHDFIPYDVRDLNAAKKLENVTGAALLKKPRAYLRKTDFLSLPHNEDYILYVKSVGDALGLRVYDPFGVYRKTMNVIEESEETPQKLVIKN